MEEIQDLRPPDGELLRSRGGVLLPGDGGLRQAGAEQGVASPSSGADPSQIRFSSTLLALQEERDKVIQQFQDEAQRRAKQNKFSNTLLRDLDEMGKALAQSRQAAKQAKRQLAQKEAEVEQLLSEKRALLRLIIEAGPWELWDWIKKEIVEQGLEPGGDFERRWSTWLAAAEGATKCSSEASNSHQDLVSGEDNVDPQASFSERHEIPMAPDAFGKTGLLWILFSIVQQEGMDNLEYLLRKGLFFLPMAWFSFWMGLYTRISWLLLGIVSSSLKRSFLLYRFHVI
ncbi:unnamed protein product [Calypogeia fissa]